MMKSIMIKRNTLSLNYIRDCRNKAENYLNRFYSIEYDFIIELFNEIKPHINDEDYKDKYLGYDNNTKLNTILKNYDDYINAIKANRKEIIEILDFNGVNDYEDDLNDFEDEEMLYGLIVAIDAFIKYRNFKPNLIKPSL